MMRLPHAPHPDNCEAAQDSHRPPGASSAKSSPQIRMPKLAGLQSNDEEVVFQGDIDAGATEADDVCLSVTIDVGDLARVEIVARPAAAGRPAAEARKTD